MATARQVERLQITRRGGIGGLKAGADLAAAELSTAERAALDALLDGPTPPPSPGADRFSYRVRVRYGDGSERTLDVPEDAMPADLAARVRPTLP